MTLYLHLATFITFHTVNISYNDSQSLQLQFNQIWQIPTQCRVIDRFLVMHLNNVRFPPVHKCQMIWTFCGRFCFILIMFFNVIGMDLNLSIFYSRVPVHAVKWFIIKICNNYFCESLNYWLLFCWMLGLAYDILPVLDSFWLMEHSNMRCS